MALQPSAVRYYGWGTQSAKGTAAAAPTIMIPAVKSQSRFWWNSNLQDEKYSTGDLFILVDSIPVRPMAQGTIVMPFKPHVLNPILANCSYANGDLIKPVWSTFFVGDGYNEKIYKDVLFTDGEMAVDDNSGPAMWTLNFLGLSAPTPATVRVVSAVQALIPPYERSFRMENLLPGTILANSARNQFESIKWRFNAGVTAYHGSKGDGTDGPSDLVINQLSAEMDFVVASIDDLMRLAQVNPCGAPGDFLTAFQTNCGGTTYSHSVELDNGIIVSDQIDAPDDAEINEQVTVRGLRSAATGHPSPAKIVIV